MTELDSGQVVRARLDFSYDGTAFSGWAAQPGLRTVQETLEAALRQVVRMADGRGLDEQHARVTVAGRTDAGVHARGQVAHVDIPLDAWRRLPGRADRSETDALRARLTGVLPADVVVREVSLAAPGFDARFSATERRYAYRLCDDRRLRDPLSRYHVVWHDKPLDVDALNAASASLIGLRDFAPFCKAREGATTIRDLKEFSWARPTDGPDAGLVVATVRADAFCHSMVRGLVGAVLAVGEGRRDLEWLAHIAAGTERSQAIAVAPAHGLTLEDVAYPDDAELAARAEQTRARRTAPGDDAPVTADESRAN
jgi:tRNA pseudouridine38-40 synthase